LALDFANGNNDDDHDASLQKQHFRRKKNAKNRYHRRAFTESSFGCLMLRVATALAFMCFVLWKGLSFLGMFPKSNIHPNEDDDNPQQQDDFVYDANAAASPQKFVLHHPHPLAAESGPVPATTENHKNHAYNNENKNNDNPSSMAVDTRNTDLSLLLPQWNWTQPELSRRSAWRWDAYAAIMMANFTTNNHHTHRNPNEADHPVSKNNNIQSPNESLFWQAADGLRERFAEQYAHGSIQMARAILERSITPITTTPDEVVENDNIPWDLQHTTCRIVQAHRDHRPFRFAFGGYSVTTGRGNYFQQSFPFVMKQQLQTLFQFLGMELEVRNAAIGGCPSFPYGWCMPNFWGHSPDVVSWDYSMNEAGGDPTGMEAYLRHVMGMPSRPKLIVIDSYSMGTDRRNILQSYAAYAKRWYSQTISSAHDPMVIHTDRVVPSFLEIQPENRRPTGFRDWRKFGAPPLAPGQSRHHPAVKEHEFIAWLISMHFLSALELSALILLQDKDGNELTRQLQTQCDNIYQSFHSETSENGAVALPQPITNATVQSTPWESLLWGEITSSSSSLLSDKNDADGSRKWRMNPIYCQTSFEPIVLGNLSDVVVSGSIGEDLDVMLPKSKMFYNRAWVLDLSDEEKKAKRNLARFGGLGFIDSKRAYYGIYTSGTLRLFLPHNSSRSTNRPRVSDTALDWIQSVTVCEVNEKKFGGKSCDIAKDAQFTVGGVNVTSVYTIDANGAMYLGKKLCTYVPIPDTALLTSRAEMIRPQDAARMDSSKKHRSVGHPEDHLVGLEVTITIRNHHIVQRDDACSVSHVIWEQKSSMGLTDIDTQR
jgi:hypothetical protein